jgi:hypothetical protein
MTDDDAFPVRRLPDGTIDYDAYHAEAARLRAEAKMQLGRGAAGRAIRLLSRLATSAATMASTGALPRSTAGIGPR